MKMLAECKHNPLHLATLFGVFDQPNSALSFCPVSHVLSSLVRNHKQRVEGFQCIMLVKNLNTIG